MDGKNPIFNRTSVFSGGKNMKRSPSEMAFRELFPSSEDERKLHQRAEAFGGADDGFFAVENGTNMGLPSDSSGILKGLSGSSSFLDASFWCQNLNPSLSSVSLGVNSNPSCGLYNTVDSPMSSTNPKGTGASSDSSLEQSDADDFEIEAGSCEQSTTPLDEKRVKRMRSNRESAQRSRKRKQAQLTELEQQVEQLQGENSSLFKQLSDASLQFKDATTNNRVLKSDVEALRAKVKLAEDRVARCSLTSSLSHLLQNYLNTTPEDYMNSSINPIDDFPSVMGFCRDENSAYNALTDSATGLDDAETLQGNSTTGVIEDTVNPVAELWPWQSHVAPVLK